MKISEAMTEDVRVVAPDESVRDAARMMKEVDSGVVPVGENDKLVGMITDRDIAVRGIAEGLGPDARIGDVMTPGVHYCFDDEELDAASEKMNVQKVRRLPVVNRDKRLVGMISLGDIARAKGGDSESQEALTGVTEPGGPHAR